ncbi:MAG: cation acetate symporter [Kutzneria sp.]|nr:cation acetate symporter [Kutzneria sp.]
MTAGTPSTSLWMFAAIVASVLAIVYRVNSRNSSRADYYAAGSAFTGGQNGLAMSGDYLSAASVLGTTGAIAVHGYDGFMYAIAWSVAWLLGVLLIVEMLRNTGRFTLGDVLAFRMRQRPVRAVTAMTTLVICFLFMIAQMAGAGAVVALLLNITSRSGQSIVIAVVGILMIFCVLVGGMRGTTWVQMFKAALLLLCIVLLTVFLLGKFNFDFSAILQQASANNSLGQAILSPGTLYRNNTLDFVSLALAQLLGACSLPHVLIRFYTVPDAIQARRTATWAVWAVVTFNLCAMIIGFGASAVVGSSAILHAPGAENSALPLLAFRIGGQALLGVVAAVAFATILAVVTGLTLTASVAFAHDVYANIIKRGKANPAREIRVARLTAVAVGVLAITGGILANGQNAAFLAGLAVAVAASAHLPSLLFSLFWRRFNTVGAVLSSCGGLSSCLLLIIFSPVVSGSPTSILPSVDFHLFPLSNPGIVSIPFAFLCGIVGTLLGKNTHDEQKQSEMEVRALTGIGVRLS